MDQKYIDTKAEHLFYVLQNATEKERKTIFQPFFVELLRKGPVNVSAAMNDFAKMFHVEWRTLRGRYQIGKLKTYCLRLPDKPIQSRSSHSLELSPTAPAAVSWGNLAPVKNIDPDELRYLQHIFTTIFPKVFPDPAGTDHIAIVQLLAARRISHEVLFAPLRTARDAYMRELREVGVRVMIDRGVPIISYKPPTSLPTPSSKVQEDSKELEALFVSTASFDEQLKSFLTEPVNTEFKKLNVFFMQIQAVLQEDTTPYKAACCFRGGSLGKGTNLANHSDVDVVAYVPLSVEKFLEEQRTANITKAWVALFRHRDGFEVTSSWDYGFSLKSTTSGAEADVLPGIDISKFPVSYYFGDRSTEDKSLLSASTVGLLRSFLSAQPLMFKAVVRAVKQWRNDQPWSKKQRATYLVSYVCELVTLYVFQTETAKPAFIQMSRVQSEVEVVKALFWCVLLKLEEIAVSHRFRREDSKIRISWNVCHRSTAELSTKDQVWIGDPVIPDWNVIGSKNVLTDWSLCDQYVGEALKKRSTFKFYGKSSH